MLKSWKTDHELQSTHEGQRGHQSTCGDWERKKGEATVLAWYPVLRSHCAGSRRSGAAWVSRWVDRCCCQGAPFSCISESAQINHPISHPCSSLTVISHQSSFLGSRIPDTDITETLRKRELHPVSALLLFPWENWSRQQPKKAPFQRLGLHRSH